MAFSDVISYKANRNSNKPSAELKIQMDIKIDGELQTVTLGYLGLFENNDIHELLTSLSANDLADLASKLKLTVQKAGERSAGPKRKIELA